MLSSSFLSNVCSMPCGRNGMLPMQSSRASHPGLTRAYVEKKRLEGDRASLRELHMEEWKARIRKQLQKVELLPSLYDTAWVAMVPLQGSPQIPCFPQCVEWILQNQQDNGSWGFNQFDSLLNKDALSSTLACVLALKRWNVGEEHVKRGLCFIGNNFSVVMDEQMTAPIGFNITFPGMLSFAMEMGLAVPLKQSEVDRVLHLRNIELQREAGDNYCGREAYMAYVVEGLRNLHDWNEVMKFQRKNGSLFNSPSATAAALVHSYDAKALQYLNLLVSKCGSSVPTAYPLNLYCQLSMVDALEKMGISRHFAGEVNSILDMTYSCWLQRDEEIMSDMTTCAMAFRLLRMNGYDVSSDQLSHVAEASSFHNTFQGYLNDTRSLLELYKASKVIISENELILDKIGSWSCSLLKEQLRSNGVQRTLMLGEVEYALKFPFYTTLERLDHKRNIEHFDIKGPQILKAAYLPCHANQDLLALAVNDFNLSQSVYQEELQHIDSWVRENRLDQLQFARQKSTYCYLSAAATIFPPELSDARISWAKNGVLTTIVDDFFDVEGSKEELENLIALVEKWDKHQENEFYSEHVKIIFSVLYTTVNQLGAKASAIQDRDVAGHLIEIWLQLLRSMMAEAEWQRNNYVPTMEEYMMDAVVSFALGPIVLPALYFVGPKLSECVVRDQEYYELFWQMSTCGRLLNDLQSFEREGWVGKVNSVSLLGLHSGGSIPIETTKKEIHKSIDKARRGLLRSVLKEQSVVPRPCKELFWKMSKIVHLFYSQTDGFSSPNEMVGAVNAVINEPLTLILSNPSLPAS